MMAMNASRRVFIEAALAKLLVKLRIPPSLAADMAAAMHFERLRKLKNMSDRNRFEPMLSLLTSVCWGRAGRPNILLAARSGLSRSTALYSAQTRRGYFFWMAFFRRRRVGEVEGSARMAMHCPFVGLNFEVKLARISLTRSLLIRRFPS